VQEQLAALTHLRTSADDAQDFLLGLVQQLLQVGGPLCLLGWRNVGINPT
jgi:hypothetical protein